MLKLSHVELPLHGRLRVKNHRTKKGKFPKTKRTQTTAVVLLAQPGGESDPTRGITDVQVRFRDLARGTVFTHVTRVLMKVGRRRCIVLHDAVSDGPALGAKVCFVRKAWVTPLNATVSLDTTDTVLKQAPKPVPDARLAA